MLEEPSIYLRVPRYLGRYSGICQRHILNNPDNLSPPTPHAHNLIGSNAWIAFSKAPLILTSNFFPSPLAIFGNFLTTSYKRSSDVCWCDLILPSTNGSRSAFLNLDLEFVIILSIDSTSPTIDEAALPTSKASNRSSGGVVIAANVAFSNKNQQSY